jgi:hypothetical protein
LLVDGREKAWHSYKRREPCARTTSQTIKTWWKVIEGREVLT